MARSPDLGYGSPDSYDLVVKNLSAAGPSHPANGRFIKADGFYLSEWPFYQGQWPFYQAKRKRDFRAGLGSRT